MIRYPIALPTLNGFCDALTIEPCGLVRTWGWGDGERPAIHFDGSPAEPLHSHRYDRPDAPRGNSIHSGIVHSFLLPPGRYERVDLTLDTGQTFTQEGPIQIASAPYASLLSESRVLPRSSIYGSGPPDAHFNPDILDACLALDGTILDFGCGTGALVRALRAKGRDARGLDLAIPIIQKAILNEARPHITLYDGQFPSPLKDGVADIVVSTEVIEHVPPYEEYLAELARLTRRHAVISTPDIAAIPLGAPSFSVPWHLLEATHVNFFTQASLGRLLEKHFSRVEFSRTVPAQLSGAAYFVSLLAFCEK